MEKSGSPVIRAFDVMKATCELEERIKHLTSNLMGAGTPKPTTTRDGIKVVRQEGLLNDLLEKSDETFAALVTANENLRRLEEYLGLTTYEELKKFESENDINHA